MSVAASLPATERWEPAGRDSWISPSSRRLVWRLRPMITWSCNTAPRGAAAFLMSWVTWISAFDGVGSPEG